jgi:hypothetical protein
MPDGYHPLAQDGSSGAMDYARSPILSNKLGCLAVIIGVMNSIFGTKEQEWITVTGSEAGDALIAMVQNSGTVQDLEKAPLQIRDR